MPDEIERRWLVHGMSFNPPPERIRIQQAYPDPYRDPCVRVRIIDGQRAELTAKQGTGLLRAETTTSLDLASAIVLHDTTPYRLRKLRFKIDGWELDCYQNELNGLVVLEREFSTTDTDIKLPGWVQDATEVTETLDNRRLAILAAHGFDAMTIASNRVPKKIVLTGGPVAGKSTLLQMIEQHFGNHLHVIPEVATINFGHLKVSVPIDDAHARRYNRHACATQRSFEDQGLLHAHLTGRRAVILDRGVLDNVAYCPEFLNVIGSSLRRELSEYLAVIHLAVPSKTIYEQRRADNGTRLASETYDVAMDLEAKIRQAWDQHPNYHFIRNAGGWQAKAERVLTRIGSLLGL